MKMNRYFFRQLISILMLPGVVLIAIPAILLWQTNQVQVGWGWPSPWNLAPILLGLIFLAAGFALMVQTISLFIRIGVGTLAPWDPTKKLVLSGPYRYMRNPMIGGVLAVLFGEAILAGSLALLIYFGFVTLLNMIYMPLSEEPGLLKRFGEEYLVYKQHVPRWIPRLTPWKGNFPQKCCDTEEKEN